MLTRKDVVEVINRVVTDLIYRDDAHDWEHEIDVLIDMKVDIQNNGRYEIKEV